MLAASILAILVSCGPVPEPDTKPQTTNVSATVAPSCGEEGLLSTSMYGSIERAIDWATSDLGCESMMRPNGEGIRIRFTGIAAGQTMAIILALPTLERGLTGSELPTIVTLAVEGSGRFFSTANLESCWTDIETQQAIDDAAARYALAGVLYCVAPLGEVNGEAAVSVPEMTFRGIIDWTAK